MDVGLQGKFVFVTGSTKGIGYGIAKCFAQVGAEVLVNGRQQDVTEKAVATIKAETNNQNIHPLVGDVSTVEGVDQIVAAIEKFNKPLDVLICNVGIFGPHDFFDIPDTEWERFFQINVMSCVRLARVYLKSMLERNSGRVIFVSSECGMRPIGDMIHYSWTKGSQINIARGLAELTKGTKVTVNTVLPGPTWTEGIEVYVGELAKKYNKTYEQAINDYFTEREPTSLIKRFVQVEEVGNTVVFYSSKWSGATNGAAILVEGGIIRHI
eukprot:TRINITY_DN720_c0_g1_i1.p1 TRINITY_DN720_c0_g1~~TRINITY_DN720_c0_g1_i1.p1  ORF type:complete len:281 (-),score=76.98 TRINITY_DN720_c0_g1_i1:36-839(-)